MRWVRSWVALLVLGGVVGLGTPTPAADAVATGYPAVVASDVCDHGGKFLSEACKKATALAQQTPLGGVATVAKAATKLPSLAGQARETLKSYTPQGAVENWAKNAAVGSTGLLADMQTKMLDSTKPKFEGADWWGKRYAVTFGLGLVVMAFALMVSLGRLSRGGPEAALLARELGHRAVFFVPAVVMAPGLVATAADIVNALAHWLGVQTAAEAGSGIKAYVTSMSAMDDLTGLPGGALTVLLFAGMIFLGAAIAMFELSFSAFGVYLLTLLFPILAAVAVNPRWRAPVAKLTGALAGLLLTPAMLFLGFWVVWGLFGSTTLTRPGADRFGLLLTVAVGTVACVAAPVLLGMLAGHLVAVPGGDDGLSNSRAVRRAGQAGGRAASSTARRAGDMMSRRGGGGGGADRSPGSRGGPRRATPPAGGGGGGGAGGRGSRRSMSDASGRHDRSPGSPTGGAPAPSRGSQTGQGGSSGENARKPRSSGSGDDRRAQ